MNKIEFSDINKFLTSLGLIVIGAAALLPWFVNQNISSILVEQNKLSNYSETAKRIITKQQENLLFMSWNLNHIVITLMLFGGLLIMIGLYRWGKRQRILDEIQNEELRSKKLQNISKDEKKEIIEGEIGASETDKSKIVEDYIQIENLIYLKLAPYLASNYATSQDIRIGRFNYDIIIKSRYLEKRGDLILEIKYINKEVSYNQLYESILNFLLAIVYYESTQNRGNVIPIIIFILNHSITFEELSEYKLRLTNDFKEIRYNLRIKFFMENEISSIKASDLIEGDKEPVI